ncbi:MAG TPA: methylenetetrahydrofolate reductase [Bacteroidales bacterium]|jgi:methylenetetrahydrofolate reductase (NADPH)|nr:methylenetetrahydrofolate reductase [Bacteroidales bacterium]
MKIPDILRNKKTLSFEIFPPKRQEDTFVLIEDTIKELSDLGPDFISVTYGALGNTLNNSVAIAKHIKQHTLSEPLAHLTCVSSDRAQVDEICRELREAKVKNILALRGDLPADPGLRHRDFVHASELTAYISTHYGADFALGGACYPEKHPEAVSMKEDIRHLKMKQDAGMDFFITQLFFDNEAFYRFLLEARKAGITIPIIPGIMPVSNYKQLDGMIRVTGAAIPLQLRNYFDRYRYDKQALEEIGIIYTSHQILDLIANDVDGIHLYSMNKSSFIKKLMSNIAYVRTGFFAQA